MAVAAASIVGGLGNLVTSIISGVQQRSIAQNAQKEARKMAYIDRADRLKQNRIQNYQGQQQIDLAEGGAAQARKQWGDQNKFLRQQYIDQRKDRTQDMMRSDRATLANNALGLVNQDQGLKNSILSRMAA